MTRSMELEAAIEDALHAAWRQDYDATMRLLALALTRAAHARSALPGRSVRIPLVGPLGPDPEDGPRDPHANTLPRES